MKVCKTFYQAILGGLCLSLAFWPAPAYAEPGGARRWAPLLWMMVLACCVLLAAAPLAVKRIGKIQRGKWVFWVVAVVLALLFLIFLGPLLVGIGNILLTGRTM